MTKNDKNTFLMVREQDSAEQNRAARAKTERVNSFSGVIALVIMFTLFWMTAAAPEALAAVTSVTPNTWNIIGLDSNTPGSGPNLFPVGAKVCSDAAGTVGVTFNWEAGGTTSDDTYIHLLANTLGTPGNPLNLSFSAAGCMDAYFEVEVAKVSAAFEQTRRYYIEAGGVKTPRPRELYVEHLVSQSRNGIDNIKFGTNPASLTSVPAGGSMNLIVGNTYYIELDGHTAPGGYNQFEEFINFPNTIFQVLSISTTYSTDGSPYVPGPAPIASDKLYADGCGWDTDPSSPYYRSCVGGDYKVGATVITTYQVKIISAGAGPQALGSLLYDFSGSSFHYNADYSTGARVANTIDPTNVTIAKSFGPNPTNAGGVSTLTFTLTNPNAGLVSGLSFTDSFPAAMVVADPSNAATTGCGTPTFAPNAGNASITFSNGTIAGNSTCTVQINVTAPATGTYANTSGHLFAGTVDTGHYATASLTVNNSAPAPSPVCGMVLAKWTFPTGFSLTSPVPSTSTVSATAAPGAGLTSASNTATATADGTNSWITNGNGAVGTPLVTTNNDYFEFAVDTLHYSSAYLNFSAERKISNSPKGIAVYTGSAPGNPETGTQIYDNSTVLAANTTWYAFGASNSLPVSAGTGTAYVRIYVYNSGNTNAGSDAYIDDVTFTACGVPAAPTMTKYFAPSSIALNAVSKLTFTVNNPNYGVALTGVQFTDALPAGLKVAAPPSASTTCGGTPTWAPAANDTTLTFGSPTGASIPANGTCTVSVNITATTAGPHNNVSGFVYSSQTGTNNAGAAGIATASLVSVTTPTITKQFAPSSILSGGTSTLTFLITNSNPNNALSGVAFTDTFPAGMTVASPASYSTSSCGSPTFTPVATQNNISFSNGTIVAGDNCIVDVRITATAAGTNTSGAVSHIINAATVNGNTASASLAMSAAYPNLFLFKEVASSNAADTLWTNYLAVPVSTGKVYYQFTVQNAGNVPLASVTVSDSDLPSGLSIASCTWYYGYDYNDRIPANQTTYPLSLAVANNINKQDSAMCVLGPYTPGSAETLTNTATATAGTYGSGTACSDPDVCSDTDSGTYATTGMAISKSASPNYFKQTGDTVTYSYGVTNTGVATLAGPITVSDDKTGTITCLSSGSYLASGQTYTCSANYTVTSTNVSNKIVTNIASASTITVGSSPWVKSSPVSVTVPLTPDLTATKTNDAGGTVSMGGSFNWTITVANLSSAGSATFTTGQVLLQDDLPTAGAVYSGPTLTKTPGTTGTINCSITTNTLTCAASGNVTIPPGDSFGAVISVLTSTAGTLVNPRSGGMCRADPNTVIAEILENNNDCGNTVTVQALPNISVVKSVSPIWDPINLGSSPKSIPGSIMLYSITVTNSGLGTADNNSLVITDPIPANTEMCADTLCSTPPIVYTCVVSPCGLTYAYATDVSYSCASPALPCPQIDGAGYSGNVTGMIINPKGVFNGSAGPTYPQFRIDFKVRVK